MYQYTKVRENIWQIYEDEGVCCTLVRGQKLALLADTGYGRRNLRSFVEANVTTPYIVINTHGHPDHIGGNHWFDRVFICAEDREVLHHFDRGERKSCPLEVIAPGEVIDLGGNHIDVVSLAGHTRGCIGLLVREERLLIAGDAMNDWLWLFNFGSLSLAALEDSLCRALEMPFDTYLGGHGATEYTKDLIRAHICNIRSIQPENCQKGQTLGFDTLTAGCSFAGAQSRITFAVDKYPQGDTKEKFK